MCFDGNGDVRRLFQLVCWGDRIFRGQLRPGNSLRRAWRWLIQHLLSFLFPSDLGTVGEDPVPPTYSRRQSPLEILWSDSAPALGPKVEDTYWQCGEHAGMNKP